MDLIAASKLLRSTSKSFNSQETLDIFFTSKFISTITVSAYLYTNGSYVAKKLPFFIAWSKNLPILGSSAIKGKMPSFIDLIFQ